MFFTGPSKLKFKVGIYKNSIFASSKLLVFFTQQNCFEELNNNESDKKNNQYEHLQYKLQVNTYKPTASQLLRSFVRLSFVIE